ADRRIGTQLDNLLHLRKISQRILQIGGINNYPPGAGCETLKDRRMPGYRITPPQKCRQTWNEQRINHAGEAVVGRRLSVKDNQFPPNVPTADMGDETRR